MYITDDQSQLPSPTPTSTAVRAMGCGLVQGFHLARPAPLAQVLAGPGAARQAQRDEA